MSAKKEETLFKFMDQGENLLKVKRGHSAYKRQLVDKIIEKGIRGRDISERRYRVSELAI
jgi:Na+-transporting NADH:ubiquinone oxidoreductase subunit NqrA